MSAISQLESVLTEATRYAEFCMRNSGRVPATMIAATRREDMLVFMPDGMGNVEEKDDFVLKCRLICAAYDVPAVVLVLESWVTMAAEGEKLDMTPPSESHERREMVVLIGESTGDHQSRFLPIVRTDAGGFWGLGDPERPQFDSFEGRFTGLLPRKPVTEENRKLGRALLEAMGIQVGRLGKKGR